MIDQRAGIHRDEPRVGQREIAYRVAILEDLCQHSGLLAQDVVRVADLLEPLQRPQQHEPLGVGRAGDDVVLAEGRRERSHRLGSEAFEIAEGHDAAPLREAVDQAPAHAAAIECVRPLGLHFCQRLRECRLTEDVAHSQGRSAGEEHIAAAGILRQDIVLLGDGRGEGPADRRTVRREADGGIEVCRPAQPGPEGPQHLPTANRARHRDRVDVAERDLLTVNRP